jgi:hypothetical protein
MTVLRQNAVMNAIRSKHRLRPGSPQETGSFLIFYSLFERLPPLPSPAGIRDADRVLSKFSICLM